MLRRRRNCARDRLILSEETIQLLSDDAGERSQTLEAQRRAIEDCLQKLPVAEQRLLLSVHTRGDSIAQIAKQLGQSARRLYSKVNALRDILGDCVRGRLGEAEKHYE